MLKSFTIGAALLVTTTIINTQIASSTEADSQSTQINISNSVSATTTPNALASVDSHTISALIAGSVIFLVIGNQSQALSKTTGKQGNKKFQNKLLNRLDRDVAERLVSSAKRSNPGQSEQWYWEKVIYDLNRDRR